MKKSSEFTINPYKCQDCFGKMIKLKSGEYKQCTQCGALLKIQGGKKNGN